MKKIILLSWTVLLFIRFVCPDPAACLPPPHPRQAMIGSCWVPATWRQMAMSRDGGSSLSGWESETVSSSAKRNKHSLQKTWWGGHPPPTPTVTADIEGLHKNAIIYKSRPRSPVSLHEIRLCLCCIRAQYLPVAWTPEPEHKQTR